jgi:nucleoside-diphosphate-sugar epimerase
MHKFDITIVGLGWLGLPLYHRLTNRGFRVGGSKTSIEAVNSLRNGGVEAFWLRLNPEAEGSDLDQWLNCRTLVINIPPTRGVSEIETLYPAQIKQLVALVSPQTKIIFVSSTSVFGSVSGVVNDSSTFHPETPSARALVACEEWLSSNRPESVVVRFAGLYGPDRHPGRFFAGKTDIPEGDAPVNFIHQHDAVRVIEKLVTEGHRALSINACAPEHPTKKEFYAAAALNGGFEVPQFLTGGNDGRKVKCNWLQQQNFQFERGIFDFGA